MFKSAWMTEKKVIKIIEKELTPLSGGEVRIKIDSCGICGTDIHFFRDFPEGKPTPLGHEAAGIIEEVGTDIRGLKAGDKVVVQNHIPCGQCKACLNRHSESCRDIITYMNDQSGLAQYLTVPGEMAVKYDGLEPWAATTAEPVTVALDLIKQADIPLGSDVLIMGPGIIGLSCIKLSLISGARNVVTVGRDFNTPRGAVRKTSAEKLGATLTVDSSKRSWKDILLTKFPEGFDRVIITSPPSTITDGIELAGFGANIIYNGISFTNDRVSFNANELHFKKKSIITSHAIPNWGFPIALDLLKRKEIDPNLLVSERFKFDDIEEAFHAAQDKNREIIKVVVDF